jgi:hypothetical protein
MNDSPDPTEFIQRGQAAARVGRRDEARENLRRAVQLAPDHAEAWLALAGVEDDQGAKAACFREVLALDPGNVEARRGLDVLAHQLEGAVPQQGAEDELEAVIAAASLQLEKAVGPAPPAEVHPDDEILYCANHPKVETMLRCNRCGKPICSRCAVGTPVGYRCRQCLGQQQAVFYSGGAADYVIGGLIAVVLGGLAGFLMSMLGYWFFALILGAPVGVGISEAVRFGVRRRRSKRLHLVVGAGIVLGALPGLLLSLIALDLWALLTTGIFLVLAVGAAVARLR